MPKRLFYIFLAISIICADKLCTAKVQHSKSFSTYFAYIDTIHFNIDDLIIGEINSLIILNDTKFVILDPISRSVVLVDIKAQNFKTVSIEKEIPGLELEPLAIYPDPVAGFWISGGRIHYFKFDEQGKLIKDYSDRNHSATDRFCVDSHGNIIIYSMVEPGLFYFDTQKNKVEKLFPFHFPPNRINMIRRFAGGGMLIDKDDNIYTANCVENKIYQYNYAGKLMNTFTTRNFDYSPIQEDLPPDKDGLLTFLMKTKGKLNFDTFQNFHFLNDNHDIAAVLVVDRMTHLELFRKDGKVINQEKIIVPDRIVFTGNNHIYVTSQPEKMDQNGDIQNPVIIKYRFKK